MTARLFPGHDLIGEGLADLARGVESIPALLVSIGAPLSAPEQRLYARLSQADAPSAHSRYNALIRRLGKL